MTFAVKGNPQKLLIEHGYKSYGQSKYSFRILINAKKEKYFHAIVEYNNPIIHLHIDISKKGKTSKGLRHLTIQNNQQIREEVEKLID